MKHIFLGAALLAAALAFTGCDDRDKDVVKPLSDTEFPQVMALSDGGDGNLEDDDKASISIELLAEFDPSGKELGGVVNPLTNNVTLNFEITDFKGFETLGDYVLGGTAFYEVDDCTTSEDEEVDLAFTLDLTTGKGSVTFPKGIEEMEIELELNPDLFDDKTLNADERGFTFTVTGLTGAPEGLLLNKTNSFDYVVLDDEAVLGDWELDASDSVAFAAFQALFGPLDEDLAALKADEVDKIEISFGYEGVEVKVELVETEEDECDPTEMVNKEIEIEGEYEIDLEDLFNTLSGDMEFAEEIEQEDGSVVEFKYEGGFEIKDGSLHLTLSGEYNDEIAEQTLILNR